MKIEFSVRASGLKNVAGALRKSDPYAVVTHISTTPGNAPTVLGKTETIENTLSPEWCHVFVVNYELGKLMKLVVSIFDEQSKNAMGSAVFDIGELLGARGNTKAKKLKKNCGTVFAHVRKCQGSGLLRLQMKGVGLKNTEGMFRKSDPFFELSRQLNAAGAQTWDNVYRSKSVADSLDPVWDTAVVDLATLCGGDLNRPVKVSVYDHESSGKHVLMGAFETTVNGLVQAHSSSTPSIALTNTKGQETGQIVLTKATVAGLQEEDNVTEKVAAISLQQQDQVAAAVQPSNKPTFLDYVSGGCELHVVVAIDFTGSNGDPRKPGTLHHIDDNAYEKAISAIVEILAKYDSDHKFPVLGFGAKYGGAVRHCFQVGDSEESRGVNGVLEAYRSVFKTGLIMSGPTVFTEVMQTAAARAQSALEAAQQSRGQQAYTILLIVTDGAVSDVDTTSECLSQISDSPLSVVIVGVGDADFSGMEFLDDHQRHATGGGGGTRDLAQFVQFNKHADSPDDITSVTLREIPEQLTGYFQSKNIQPNAAIVTDEAEIVIEEEEEEIDLSLDIGEDEIVVTGGGCQERSW